LTACSPIAIVRPPTLALLVATALMICGIETPNARMRLRSISAWNSLVLPPSTSTSDTPGTMRSLRSTTQSCSVLSCITSTSGGPLSSYRKISLIVPAGEITGCTPCGRSASRKRFMVCWRTKW
jgi:hypothetical protein